MWCLTCQVSCWFFFKRVAIVDTAVKESFLLSKELSLNYINQRETLFTRSVLTKSALSSFSFHSLLTTLLIWCCCPLIFQMGIILPFVFRYQQGNHLQETGRIRPRKGKIVRFIPLFQASKVSPAELRKRQGQAQLGLVVSPWKEGCRRWVPGRVLLGEQSWQSLSVCVPREWGAGWDFPGMPGTWMPFLCAALQVHPRSSKGQLQVLLSRRKGRKATWNLPGKREQYFAKW